MHELGLARNIVSIVCEHANGQAVQRVRLELGSLSAVASDAIRFCFDICAKGTLAEGAELQIDEIQARGVCLDCRREMQLEQQSWICSCGSNKIQCLAGLELKVKEMEVA
jgi:hydrogenase nickel incorporation protein HypA/HybF